MQWYDDGGDGIVLSAPNGGESPSRGHVDALNAKTGALVWNWTTPDPTAASVHPDRGPIRPRRRRVEPGATTDPRIFSTQLSAINMTKNTFAW
jgi:outer membrane protein assembly factor BamB